MEVKSTARQFAGLPRSGIDFPTCTPRRPSRPRISRNPVEPTGPGGGRTLAVPLGFWDKLDEAFRLLTREFAVIAPLMLLAYMPALVLFLYREELGLQRGEWVLLAGTYGAAFGPATSGALVHTLAQRKSGRRTSLGGALSIGFSLWGSLFPAHLAWNFGVLGGLNVFVVPGLYLARCLAVLDPVVVIEDPGIREAMRRSDVLTTPRRWSILGTLALVFAGRNAIIAAEIEAANHYPQLAYRPVLIALSILPMLVSSLGPILMFLYYWEARHDEPSGGDREETPIRPPVEARDRRPLARALPLRSAGGGAGCTAPATFNWRASRPYRTSRPRGSRRRT